MDSFLFQASIYLAAAVIAVPFASRLGLGSVLGYLAAGGILGPGLGPGGVGTEEREQFGGRESGGEGERGDIGGGPNI